MASEQGNLGMVSVFRTYVHSYKNRHLNIVLQAELFLRTGTYDRPKNTVPVQDTVIRLDPPSPEKTSPEKTPSPGDRHLSTYSLLLISDQTIWALYPTGSGNVGLAHSLMKHLGEVGNI